MEKGFLSILAAILAMVWLVGIILSVGALINILLFVVGLLLIFRLLAGTRKRRTRRKFSASRPMFK